MSQAQETLPERRLSSYVVSECQVCRSTRLDPVLFLGYLPPVNHMRAIGSRPIEEVAYPAQLLRCTDCDLVQLGLVVDKRILFPPEYPYRSGTTRILRDNFAALAGECRTHLPFEGDALVVDIGANDGTLLSAFRREGYRICGIEPTSMAEVAIAAGIPSIKGFLEKTSVDRVRAEYGMAKIVTATNVFAHIEDVHTALDNILSLLDADGVFISESHYLIGLLATCQYDTIYHEHLRYYSLHSLKRLLEMHDLEVIRVKRIDTHGGSIRVYATRRGRHPVSESVDEELQAERAAGTFEQQLVDFGRRVLMSKLMLHDVLLGIKRDGARIYGVGAPSRASTLIHYAGLDDGIVDCVVEVSDSHKLGKYMPGTVIPVVDEKRLFEDQPEYALLFSWHIAEELVPKLAARGFTGKYLIPLPEPRVVSSQLT
jgi:C-methyltransferase-like protein/methyltransferase family protein/putative zinc binding protein